MSLNIYGTSNSEPCKRTIQKCQEVGIKYRYFDLSLDDRLREKIKALGYSSSPIVENPGIETWSGYQPDKIKQLTHRN